jgi:D-alanyl-D-alanine carboxypeptidase
MFIIAIQLVTTIDMKSGKIHRLILTLLLSAGWFVTSAANLGNSAISEDNSEVRPPALELRMDTIGNLVEKEDYVRAGLLYDVEKGVVVWERNMHKECPIASLTKMMVALLAYEDVQNGKVCWEDTVNVKRSYRSGRRGVYHTTEQYTLEGLVQLALIPSNNLACSDIGIFLEGSVKDFVARMNSKAKSLGMNNTFYSNPSGLPASYSRYDNHSTPRDLLILSLQLINTPDLLKLTSIGYVEVNNGKRDMVHRNNNRLVIDYEDYVDGLKTGYTRRARSCLAATANKDNYRLISIVLGVGGPYLRNEIVASMLNDYYEQIGCGMMVKNEQPPLLQRSVLTEEALANEDKMGYRLIWTKEKKIHRVRAGETLSGIGARYGIPYSRIKSWNGLRSNSIYQGQRLSIYVSTQKRVAVRLDAEGNAEDLPVDESTETEPQKTKTAQSSKPAPAVKNYELYVVQPGDTLWNIANRYDGISADDLRRLNNIRSPKALKPGTRLKIQKQS